MELMDNDKLEETKNNTYNRFKYPVYYGDLFTLGKRQGCYMFHAQPYEYTPNYRDSVKHVKDILYLKINDDYIETESDVMAFENQLYLTIPAAIKVIGYLITSINRVNFYESAQFNNEKTKDILLKYQQHLVDMTNEHIMKIDTRHTPEQPVQIYAEEMINSLLAKQGKIVSTIKAIEQIRDSGL